MEYRFTATRRFLLFPAALLVLSGCSSKPREPEENVGSAHENWMIAGGYSHGNQTKQGLYFLKKEVRDLLAAKDQFTDKPLWLNHSAADDTRSEEDGEQLGTKEHSYFHFDNCRFQEATTLLNQHYDLIVNALNDQAGAYSEGSPPWATALQQFGYVLHASQDFYAHSNWVESGETGLLDSGALKWTVLTPNAAVGKNMQVLEVGLPSNSTATLNREQHTVTLTGATKPFGLVTGLYANADHGGGTACPQQASGQSVSMQHGPAFACNPVDLLKACQEEHICSVQLPNQASCGDIWRRTYLAKDSNPDISPGVAPVDDVQKRWEWRNKAHDLAEQQTVQEFCRLSRLLDDRYRPGQDGRTEPGHMRLYRAWVEDATEADLRCGLQSTFMDVTSQSKLSDVHASRLSVADLNGDNYPDLLARDASDKESDLTTPGKQHAWVLFKNAQGGFDDKTTSSGLLAGRLAGSGSRNQRASQVVAFGDLNNDGALDAFLGSPPYTPRGLSGVERPELMLNDAKNPGKFARYASYPLPVTTYPGGASFVDYDRDGAVDLLISARDPSSSGTTTRGGAWLFKGNGSSTAPLANSSNLLSGAGGYFEATLACDLNGDGRPELMAPAMDRGPARLWQATASGTYTERGVLSGFAYDANQSLTDDLRYLAHCSYVNSASHVAWNAFWSSAKRCGAACPADCKSSYPCDSFRAATDAEKTACAGAPAYPAERANMKPIDAASWVQSRDGVATRLGGHTFSMQCADFDGDGRLDILQATSRGWEEGNGADTVHVLRNITDPNQVGGDVKLEHLAGAQLGVLPHHEPSSPWVESDESVAVFDMDNDGRPDVFLDGASAESSRGRLLKNVTAFAQPGSSTKLGFVGQNLPGLERASGVAVADFDRDGDLDMVVGRSCYHLGPAEECTGEQVRFFENQLPASANTNWLELKLVGQTGSGNSNKAAIGARVAITLKDHQVVQEVGGGYGAFGSQSDLVLHFGLGNATPNATVVVSWPASRAQRQNTLTLAVNKVYQIEEVAGGAPKVTALTFPKP